MYEEEKDCFKINTESSALVLDESFTTAAKPLLASISNSKKQLDNSISETDSASHICNHSIFQSHIFHQKIFRPRIEIVTQNECCNSVTHQSLIFPPQTPIKVTIETGSICLVESNTEKNDYFYSINKFKNWFHQYLTLWLFLGISILQLVLTVQSYSEKETVNIETFLSYIVQPKTDNGLSEDHVRIHPCGHSTSHG